MFEWWYAFWRWLTDEVSSGRFWKPYQSIGFWFIIIIISFILAYVFLIFGMPWNWFKKEKKTL